MMKMIQMNNRIVVSKFWDKITSKLLQVVKDIGQGKDMDLVILVSLGVILYSMRKDIETATALANVGLMIMH